MRLLSSSVLKKSKNQENASFYDIELNDLSGNPIKLKDFEGKYILVVNVASKCGFTSQYKGLQSLYDMFNDKLMIIGVPCNQFGSQEPGNAEEINTFCERNYGVSFLMTEKINVKGPRQHPLYAWLTSKALNGKSNSSVKWNFQKYLIGKNGSLIDYYLSVTGPTSKRITKHLK